MSPNIPLYSSKQVIKTLERLGFKPYYKKPGSHQTYYREDPKTHIISKCTVLLGKKEYARGSLRATLRDAKIPLQTFIDNVK